VYKYSFYVVYRVLATSNRSPRIAYRQSLWLAGMWHAYWAAGSDVQAISNLVIGFPFFGTRSLVNG